MITDYDRWLLNPPQRPAKTAEELVEGAQVCAAQGHDDVVLTPEMREAYPMVECQRCGRYGWRAPA